MKSDAKTTNNKQQEAAEAAVFLKTPFLFPKQNHKHQQARSNAHVYVCERTNTNRDRATAPKQTRHRAVAHTAFSPNARSLARQGFYQISHCFHPQEANMRSRT